MLQASNIGNQPFLWLEQWQTNTPPCRRYGIYFNTKKLYKETIWSKTSCKARNGQLGKFYFPVGKIFFLSWKIIFFQLGTFRTLFDAFLFDFDLIWLLSVNTKMFYVFIFASTNIKIHIMWAMSFEIRQKNIRVKRTFFSRSSIVSASSACHCPTVQIKVCQ